MRSPRKNLVTFRGSPPAESAGHVREAHPAQGRPPWGRPLPIGSRCPMSRPRTLFVLVPLVALTLTPSRARADIQTSEALDVTCLNQLNAHQIRFDRTVPYGSNNTVVIELPAQSQETVCGAYGWIRFSGGVYNRLHVASRYAGPDI